MINSKRRILIQNVPYLINGTILLFDDSPYYVKHKQDHSIQQVLEEKNCPLSEKCTFYNAIKEGNPIEIDWNNSKCPLAEKW